MWLPPPPLLSLCSLNIVHFKHAVRHKGSETSVVDVMTADEPAADDTEEGEITKPTCNKRFKPMLHPVVSEYPDVFAVLPSGLLAKRGVGRTIDTDN